MICLIIFTNFYFFKFISSILFILIQTRNFLNFLWHKLGISFLLVEVVCVKSLLSSLYHSLVLVCKLLSEILDARKLINMLLSGNHQALFYLLEAVSWHGNLFLSFKSVIERYLNKELLSLFRIWSEGRSGLFYLGFKEHPF